MASATEDHSNNDNIDLAESFKMQGNEAFKKNNLKSALDLYTKGINLITSNVSGSIREVTPTKTLLSNLYNNRAAVYIELKKYEDAIKDARKSINTVENAKGYLRLGASYWNQNKLRLALDSYQNGLLKFPDDPNIAENMSKLKKIIEDSYNRDSNSFGSATSHGAGINVNSGSSGDKRCAVVDILIFFFVLLQFVTLIFLQSFMLIAWKGMLILMIFRCFLLLRSNNNVSKLSDLFNFKLLSSTFGGNYILLCLVLFVFMVPPMPTIVAPIAIYTIVDLATTQRNQIYFDGITLCNDISNSGKLRIPIISTNQAILTRINSFFDIIQQNKEPLLCNAATLEITSPFFCFLGGSGFIVMFMLFQFIKLRYRYDNYYKLSFAYISGMLGKLFYHQRCPAIFGTFFTKFKELLHNLASV